jgi:hypothetical protein
VTAGDATQQKVVGLRTWKSGPLSPWSPHPLVHPPFPWFLPLGTSDTPGDDSNSNADQDSNAVSDSQEGGVSIRVGGGVFGAPKGVFAVRSLTCDEQQERLLVLGA